jgi:hypothetical protein
MKKQSDEIIEDITEFRQKVKSQGEKVSTFWRFIGSILLRKAAHSFTSTSKKKAGTNSKRKHKSEATDAEDMEQDDENSSEDDTF